VASRVDDTGALVLSEFAGAATELHEALQINPYDLDAFVEAARHALEMPAAEQKLRMSALRKTVHAGSASAWAAGFLAALEESPAPPAVASSDALSEAMLLAAAAPQLLLLLDYDGTLMEFSSSPRSAMPDLELYTLLGKLSRRPGTTVQVVSGRSRESLEDFLGALELGLHAEHGLWSRPSRGAPWVSRTPLPPPWLEAARKLMERVVRRTDGSFLEVKSGALAFHYRATEPQLGQRRISELRGALLGHALADGFELLEGSRVLEVRQKGINKGVVVPALLEAAPGALVLAMGDDRTDEALFGALPPEALSIHVGTGLSLARYRLPDVEAVRALLWKLVERTPGA
jgi:trehalose 6-phosphate synthase/phosphatase